MLRKIIGKILGAQAKSAGSALGGKRGMVAGAIAMAVVRRMSLPAMVVLGAGGWLVRRLIERRRRRLSRRGRDGS